MHVLYCSHVDVLYCSHMHVLYCSQVYMRNYSHVHIHMLVLYCSLVSPSLPRYHELLDSGMVTDDKEMVS